MKESECVAPIYCFNPKIGGHAVAVTEEQKANGAKESLTHFRRLHYDPETNTSLLECIPITGRTHQIRVHLQHIGHPILNDTCYGGQEVGNLFLKQTRESKDQNEELKEPKIQKKTQTSQPNSKEKTPNVYEEFKENEKEVIEKTGWNLEMVVATEKIFSKTMEICLHSKKYEIIGKVFVAPDPYWAIKDFHTLTNK